MAGDMCSLFPLKLKTHTMCPKHGAGDWKQHHNFMLSCKMESYGPIFPISFLFIVWLQMIDLSPFYSPCFKYSCLHCQYQRWPIAVWDIFGHTNGSKRESFLEFWAPEEKWCKSEATGHSKEWSQNRRQLSCEMEKAGDYDGIFLSYLRQSFLKLMNAWGLLKHSQHRFSS